MVKLRVRFARVKSRWWQPGGGPVNMPPTWRERGMGREGSWALACSRRWPEGWPEALRDGGRHRDGTLQLR